MKKIITIIILCVSLNSIGQSPIEAKPIDNWSLASQNITIDPIYDRVSSYVFILNKTQWLELFKGKEFDRKKRKEIGIKRGEEPDYLNVSIRFKHPELKGNINDNGEDIGIKVPLFTYDNRENIDAINFKSFENDMFLNDVKSNSVLKDVMGLVEVEAISSNDSEKFWLEVAKISADFGKSAISLATGDPTALGEIKSKLSNHLDIGLQSLDGLTSNPQKRNYSTWIKLLSRNVDNEFSEIVSGIRLYEINWSNLEFKNYNGLSTEYGFPQNEFNKPTVQKVKDLIDSSNLNVPLILVIEVKSKTKIDKRNPKLTKDYDDWASKEYREYSQQKQFSLIQEYYENYQLAFQSANAVELFLKNQGKDNEKTYLYEAINNAYKYKKRSSKHNQKNLSQISDNDLKPIIEIIEKRYNSINNLLNSKFAQSENYDLRESSNILSSLTEDLDANSSEENKILFIKRMNEYEGIIDLSNSSEALLSESFNYSIKKRNELENEIYQSILNKTANDQQDRAFFQQIIKDYNYCKICQTSATKKINDIDLITLEDAKTNFNKKSNRYFENFNSERNLLTSQFSKLDKWIISLDEVSQTKYKPYYNRMVNAIPVWVNLMKKDKNEIDKQQDIAIINEWSSKLDNAMNDIIIGSVFFSDKSQLDIPDSILEWFTSKNRELTD